MIKKILIALLAALPLAASAQLSSGKWVTHTRFAISSTQNVIDTKDKVYSLVNNSLYCFDKSTKAQTVLSNQNQLSGTLISGIYYNYDKQYLVVAYDDSNIDRAQLYYHSTAGQAAQVARDAKVGKLLLGHFSARHNNEEVLLQDARKVFPESFLTNEGLTFDV